MRSILLMKQSRGTWYLAACRQTVSLCASTPSTAEKMTTAPSRTRSERSTSAVKSTWPGVSMMLIVIGWPAGVLPVAGDRRGDDRDPPLALLLEVVGGRGPLVHVAHPVDLAGVVEDALGRRRLAGVDVRDDADVADRLQMCGVAVHGGHPRRSKGDVGRGPGRGTFHSSLTPRTAAHSASRTRSSARPRDRVGVKTGSLLGMVMPSTIAWAIRSRSNGPRGCWGSDATTAVSFEGDGGRSRGNRAGMEIANGSSRTTGRARRCRR